MTRHYRLLKSGERQLRKSLISKTVLRNPITKISQYRLRSYRLLVHAEIECFLENIILDKIDDEEQKWNNTSKINNCIANIVAFSGNTFPNIPSNLADISTRNDFKFRINKCIRTFKDKVNLNNGIKENNIIPLFVQLGVDYSRINQTLLNNLSSYGEFRGDSAHKSIKTQQLINPIDEITIVSYIITDLNDIDVLITQI